MALDLQTAVLTWVAVELALVPLFFLLRRRLSPVRQPPVLSKSERRALWDAVLGELEPLDSFLPTWFSPRVPLREIGELNAAEFLGWAFWHRALPGVPVGDGIDEMSAEDLEEALGMLREAQDKLGGEKLRKGYYNPELRCSRLTMDNIKALPRPWAVYLFTHMASYFHHLALRWLYGFDYRTFSDVPYLIRDPKPTASVDGGKDSKSGAAADDPIVFVHGIGIGSPPYHHFLDSLIRRFPNRKIAVILLPHVSMRIHHRVPSRGEWIDAVGGILRREGISRAAWVAHSLGTTCFAWVAKHRPEWVSSAVLIDPVCFALWDGNVADNFVYSDRFGSLADRIVRFMAGRELFAAHALARHFIWHENQLLASHLGDLKAGVRAFVAEKDAIADPTRCEAWCRKHGIDVTVMPGLGHAGWLFKGDWTTKVIDAI